MYGAGGTTFEHQLEAFAAEVSVSAASAASAAGGASAGHGASAHSAGSGLKSAVTNMQIIDSILLKAGASVLRSER